MTKDSLAIAVEALSWMGYTGIGERAALLKASGQMNITNPNDLRQAHKWIMEVNRFQNRLDFFISKTSSEMIDERTPHGIRSLIRILAYMRIVAPRSDADLVRNVQWARQLIGWKEMRPYEEQIGRIVSSPVGLSTESLSEFERIAVETCHPTWYVRRLVTAFGRVFALKILNRDLSPVSTFARVNDLKSGNSPGQVDELRDAAVSGLKGVYLLDKKVQAKTRTELTSSGIIIIQDLGSIVAGLAAAPHPGETVLDLCAAPGNKTGHLADQMRNNGTIYSVEKSAIRSAQWKKEMGRIGCSIANLIMADGRRLPLRSEFNVVLVDPPCSNSGVFARNPASKWRITPSRLNELVQSQAELLQAGSEKLIDGGSLVYCTCSVLPEENELIIERFLRKNPEFSLTQQTPFLGWPGLRGLAECQRFYPHVHNCNGYFVAKMRKC